MFPPVKWTVVPSDGTDYPGQPTESSVAVGNANQTMNSIVSIKIIFSLIMHFDIQISKAFNDNDLKSLSPKTILSLSPITIQIVGSTKEECDLSNNDKAKPNDGIDTNGDPY